ncbi:hypothetical protein [Pelotomaculum propionicicum]|uniref:DUF6848 domain-containing protein n=1 Tax=Pelotomaculum propionicicum TaxID=258475 RepID=A0A4Y7RK65_9FIRM|nr:hypothetical protein [Pelotomaculum propionicicum]TEB09140.1 hypothetical protein Pmgp_03361 [Pelotomaculum propionicicum]
MDLNPEALKDKYGNIFPVTVEGLLAKDGEEKSFTFYFQEAKTAHINRYLKEAAQRALDATKNFLYSLVVPEQMDEMKAAFGEFPLLPLKLADPYTDQLGLGASVNIQKKL